MRYFARLSLPAVFSLLTLAATGQSAPDKKPVPQPGSDQYVTPSGAGNKSGRDWANARPAAELQAALDAAGPGNSVRVGSGTYENVSLQFNTGGSGANAMKALIGVDTGGGLPVSKSNFDNHKPSKTGVTFVAVAANVSYVLIRDFVLQNHSSAVKLRGRHLGVRIENVDVTNTRDAFWIEGGATPEEPYAGTRDLVIRNCDVKNFTKRAMRFLNGNANVQVINCHADEGGKEYSTEVFPIGYHILGGEGGVIDRDITFTDCSAANSWNDAGKKYWNGDGWAAEGASSDITWTRCVAWGNTDGGWDIKSLRPKLVDCISIGNKRNYRIWPREEPAVLENCLAAYSREPKGGNPSTGFWIKGGAKLHLTRCTVWGDGASIVVEDGTKDKPTTLKLDRCLIVPLETGAALRLSAGVDVQNTGSIVRQDKNDPAVTLRQPSKQWRGGDDSFDSTSHPDLGYRY
ncbi:MAG: right-handed parallel beta-helix repeat-containing protein [Armatimonadota bacterium]|nr:right-handed parallel beta-helix repeat-containing protein [Armatimonadota bacterium]